MFPDNAELRQLAALIGAQPPTDFAIERPDIQQLDYHGITMLVEDSDALSPSLRKQLALRRALMVAGEALKAHALKQLAHGFHEAGLKPLLIKGTALAYSHYAQPWQRPRTDTDMLIERSELERYASVFDALGYDKLFAIEGRMVSYQSTYSKTLSANSALNIDLHWRISNRQILSNTLLYADMVERSQHLSQIEMSTVDDVDALLIACQHRLGHHQREERLAWLYDIYLIASGLDESQWQALCKRAITHQLAALTLDGLKKIESLFDFSLPQTVHSELAMQSEEPSQIFLQREMPEWRIAVYELRAISGINNKVRWIIENVLPNSAYVKQQMNQESFLLAHGMRISRGVKRLFTRQASTKGDQ